MNRWFQVQFQEEGVDQRTLCGVQLWWFLWSQHLFSLQDLVFWSTTDRTWSSLSPRTESTPPSLLHPLCYILFAPPLSLHPLYSTLSKKPALSLYPVLSSVLERLLKKVVLTSTDTDGGISCFCPIQTLKPRSGKWKGVCVCNTHTEGKRRCVSAPPPSLLLPLLSFTSEQQSSP